MFIVTISISSPGAHGSLLTELPNQVSLNPDYKDSAPNRADLTPILTVGPDLQQHATGHGQHLVPLFGT
jgi:hypothetical protein